MLLPALYQGMMMRGGAGGWLVKVKREGRKESTRRKMSDTRTHSLGG